MIKTADTTNAQLVAAWNCLMMSIRIASDKTGLSESIAEVRAELDRRGIPNSLGKLIKKVEPVEYSPELVAMCIDQQTMNGSY